MQIDTKSRKEVCKLSVPYFHHNVSDKIVLKSPQLDLEHWWEAIEEHALFCILHLVPLLVA